MNKFGIIKLFFEKLKNITASEDKKGIKVKKIDVSEKKKAVSDTPKERKVTVDTVTKERIYVTEEIEYLFRKLEEKKKNSNGDDEKLKKAERMLSISDIFFRVDAATALGLMDYLDVPDDKMKELYLKLVSIESYQKVVGKTYLCIPPKE